jgi:PKD repeat protein
VKVPTDPRATVDASTATMTVEVTFGGTPLRNRVSFGTCPFTLYRDPTPEAPYGQYVASICSNDVLTLAGQAVGTHTYLLLFNGPPVDRNAQPVPVSQVTTTLVAGGSSTQNFEVNGTMALVTGTLTVNGGAPGSSYYACLSDQYGLYTCARPHAATGSFTLMDFAGNRSLGVRGTNTYIATLATRSYTAGAGETVDLGTVAVSAGALTGRVEYDGKPLSDLGMRYVQGCFLYLGVDLSPQMQSFCASPFTLDALPTGTHSFQLKFYPGTTNQSLFPIGTVDATVLEGQTTDQTFELNGVMGLVTGTLREGDHAPAAGAYVVCNASLGSSQPCTAPDPTTGAFTLLDVAGNRTATVRRVNDYSGGQTFSYTISNGHTTDVGTVDIVATRVTFETQYKHSPLSAIGVSSQAYCEFYLYRDPSPSNPSGTFVNAFCPGGTADRITVENLSEGEHVFQLRYIGPPATQFDGAAVVGTATVNVVSGTPATHTFELGGVMGLVSGELTINGQAPGSGYLLCTGSFSYYYPCVSPDPVTGSFKFLDLAGARLGIVRVPSSAAAASSFGYTVVAGETTIVGTTTGGVSGNTDVGTHVSITPVDAATGTSPATLVFAEVRSGGLTTVSTSGTGPAKPPKTKLGQPAYYYNIATSATYGGTISLCINYSTTTFSNPSKARLLHGDGAGGWIDITTSNDLENHVICGETASLSPFLIVEPDNSAPVAALGGPYAGNEGAPIEFDGSGSSDADGDALSYAWDFGDGTRSKLARPSHAYADNGTYTVKLTVTDPSQLESTVTGSVSVANVAPKVIGVADATLVSGQSYSLSASFADPGTNDGPWTTSLSFGEGSAIPGTASSTSAAITGEHQYLKIGTYSVRLSVTDKDGKSGTGAATVTVKRLSADLSFAPFLSSLPQAPIIYDARFPERSTPLVVALLGSPTLQVADPVTRAPKVDVASLRLGRTPVMAALGKYVVATTDVNRDGQLDLVLTFAAEQLVANGDLSTAPGAQAVLLTADHVDGRQLAASGQVSVVLKSALNDR